MQRVENSKVLQNIIFFITIWIFFSLNSKYLRIPNADIFRWVFLGLLVIISLFSSGNFALRPPAIIYFFIIAILPSVFMGINQKEAFIKFLSFIVVVWGGYICFSSLNSRDALEMLLKIMMFIMIAFEIQSIYYVIIGRGYDGTRMTGITTNSNTLGVYSNLAFLASFYWFGKCEGFRKIFFLLMMFASSYTALASGSRTAFVTIAINIIVAWVVIFRKSILRLLILLPIILFIVLAATDSLESLGIQSLNRLINTDEGTTRGELWVNGIRIWKQYPIFGCGYELSSYLNKDTNGLMYPFHNSYISILAEVGLWGVVVFGACFVRNMIRLFKSFIQNARESTGITAFMISFMMIVELLIAAWSESFLFAVGSTEACTFWMLFTWSLVYIEKFQTQT